MYSHECEPGVYAERVDREDGEINGTYYFFATLGDLIRSIPALERIYTDLNLHFPCDDNTRYYIHVENIWRRNFTSGGL